MAAPIEQQFMAVCFTEQQRLGVHMPTWFQHVTLVPWSIGNIRYALDDCAESLQDFQPFRASVGETTYFGPEKDVPVLLIEPREVLHTLHDALMGAFERHATVQEDQDFVHGAYVPHITPKPHQPELQEGNSFRVNMISIVTKLGDHRSISYQLGLGGE